MGVRESFLGGLTAQGGGGGKKNDHKSCYRSRSKKKRGGGKGLPKGFHRRLCQKEIREFLQKDAQMKNVWFGGRVQGRMGGLFTGCDAAGWNSREKRKRVGEVCLATKMVLGSSKNPWLMG